MDIDLDRVRRWMPFDIQRFMADPKVRRMPTTTRALYAYLLLTMWESSDPVGTLPPDEADIAKFIDLPLTDWELHAPAIRQCFILEEGLLVQRGMQEIWAEQVRKYRQKVTASTAAIRSRGYQRRRVPTSPPPADTPDGPVPPAEEEAITIAPPPRPARTIKPVDPEQRRRQIEEQNRKLMAEAEQ
jgi:hypothetical protein